MQIYRIGCQNQKINIQNQKQEIKNNNSIKKADLSFSGELHTDKIRHLVDGNENFKRLFDYVEVLIKKKKVSKYLHVFIDEMPAAEAKACERYKPTAEHMNDPEIRKYWRSSLEKGSKSKPIKENFKVSFNNIKTFKSGEFGIHFDYEEKGNANFVNLWSTLKEKASENFL